MTPYQYCGDIPPRHPLTPPTGGPNSAGETVPSKHPQGLNTAGGPPVSSREDRQRLDCDLARLRLFFDASAKLDSATVESMALSYPTQMLVKWGILEANLTENGHLYKAGQKFWHHVNNV